MYTGVPAINKSVDRAPNHIVPIQLQVRPEGNFACALRVMSEENNISIIKKNQTNNESMKFEFIETMPSSLEPEASATAVEELLEAPADPSATEDADVNIQSLTRPSTPQVTFVSVKKQVRDETQTCTMS